VTPGTFERPLQRQPGRGLGLPQQIAEIAFFAAPAPAGGAGRAPARSGFFSRFFSGCGRIFSRCRFFDIFRFSGPALFAPRPILPSPKFRSCA